MLGSWFVMPVTYTFAASVTSSGASDEIRCSSAGYQRGGSGGSATWGQLSKCYTKNAFPVAWQGTHFTSSTSTTQGTGSAALWHNGSANTANGCTVTGGSTYREYWYGPMTGTPFGTLPPQSVVTLVYCATGTYFNNLSMAAAAQYTAAASYVYPTSSGVSWALTASADTVDTNRVGSAGGLKWNGLLANLAAAEAMAWPPDWYPGGSGWSTTECSVVALTLSPDPANKGQVMTASSTVTGTAPAGLVVEYQSPGSSTWTVMPSPGSITWTAPVPTPSSRWVFRCRTTGTPGNVYLQPSTSPTSAWSTTAVVVSGCDAAVLTWPTDPVATGTSANFGWFVPAGATVASLDWVVMDPDDGSVPTAATVRTTARSGDAGPVTVTITVTGLVAGQNLNSVWWRCRDANSQNIGGQYNAGWVYGSVPDGSGDCFDSTDLGWSPSSWVGGLVRGMGCVILWLIVPDEEALSSFGSTWGGTWLGRFLSPVTDAVEGFHSWGEGPGPADLCAGSVVELDLGSDYSGHHVVGMDPFGVCSDTNDAIEWGQSISMWVSKFAVVLVMVGRVRSLYENLAAP